MIDVQVHVTQSGEAADVSHSVDYRYFKSRYKQVKVCVISIIE
jgi:hypothetical protein